MLFAFTLFFLCNIHSPLFGWDKNDVINYYIDITLCEGDYYTGGKSKLILRKNGSYEWYDASDNTTEKGTYSFKNRLYVVFKSNNGKITEGVIFKGSETQGINTRVFGHYGLNSKFCS